MWLSLQQIFSQITLRCDDVSSAIAYWSAILVAFTPPAAFQRESRSQYASTGAEWSKSAPRMLDAPPCDPFIGWSLVLSSLILP